METYRVHYRHPSFSSSLLDHIYRSIDDSPSLDSTTDHNMNHHHHSKDREKSPDFEISRRSITATTGTADSLFRRYSNSSSSDSSGFFSSETDSIYGRSKSSTFPPKPIRTSVDHSVVQKPNVKQELGGFRRTKSKALKIYTDLKKVKQPISPGGRLATFLNSLFTNSASNHKKPKKTSETQSANSSSSSTTCSSASSFSRSCLSKTPSSSGKSKRSVRFCPINVILDQHSSTHIPCDYSNRLYGKNDDDERRVIEAAKDLLRTYHNKNKDHLAAVTTTTKCDDVINVEEDDDDDDAASYASSDLFELENLSAIGIERYQEELPVYETTRLDNTNRAIATKFNCIIN